MGLRRSDIWALDPRVKGRGFTVFTEVWAMDRRPAMNGVRAAADRLRGIVTQTPLLPLDWERRRIWIKAECLQQGGSFKLRGATNRLLLLSEAERARGVVAFSSGNHALGIAIAARR